MLTIVPIIYILTIAICLSVLSNKSLCLTIPSTILGVSFLIMVGGYVGDLRIGVYVVMLIIPFSAVCLYKGKKYKQIINKYELVIVIMFFILFLYYAWYHKNHSLSFYDDYSHWGPMVKGMVKYNKLYCDLNINNNHPEYPPLIQCFEYLWCYLAGGFTTSSVYRAISVFTFSSLLPLIKLFNRNNIKEFIYKMIIFLLILVLLPFVNYVGLFSYIYSIYVDSTIASIAAITFILAILVNYDDIFECSILSLFLSSLLLIKEIGIAFYLMDIFAILLMNIKSHKKGVLKKIILFIIIPLFLLISWKIKTMNIVGQFSLGKVNIIDVLKIIFLNIGSQQSILVKESFISALFTKPIITGIVNVSFVVLATISLVAITVLSIFICNNKFKTATISITYFLGIIGYSLCMLFLYLTCFEEYESTRLASFDRYFGIYIYFSITIIMLFLLAINKKKINIISIILMLLLVNFRIKNVCVPRSDVQTEDPKVKCMIEQLDSVNLKTSDKILIYHYDEFGSVLVARFNYLENVIKGIALFDLDKEKEYKTSDDLIKQYEDATYVYLYSSGEKFYKAWKDTNNDDLLNGRLYRVENGILKLVPWAN